MSPAVIPFKLDVKAFVIALLVITALVRLIFILLAGVIRRSWLWNRATGWINPIRLDGMAERFSANMYNRTLMVRRGRKFPDATADEVNVDRLTV
jgi:hypothetical protein